MGIRSPLEYRRRAVSPIGPVVVPVKMNAQGKPVGQPARRPRGGGAGSPALLLLKMDGAEASATFTDSSAAARTVTAIGQSQQDFGRQLLGANTGLFDGAGDYLTVEPYADFAFGTSDFTVEFQAWRSATKDDALVFSTTTDGSASGGYWVAFQADNFTLYGPGSTPVIRALSAGTAGSTWHHWAVSRQGNTFRMFRDGALIQTAASTISLVASKARVAGNETFSGFDPWFAGSLADLRITPSCLYTANFTPPAARLA